MNVEVLAFIKREQRKAHGIFLRYHNNKVYWMQDHWKTLDPEDVKPVLLGQGYPPKGVRPSNRVKGAKVIYLY